MSGDARPGDGPRAGSHDVVELAFRLGRPAAEVFRYLADPTRLDRLTPGWFRLRIVDRPDRLGPGARLVYRLRWRGVPLGWRSRIVLWRPTDRFDYEQERGPFRYFRHEHYVRPLAGGSEIVDRIVYRAPLGRLLGRAIVRPDLRRILAYRRRALQEVFG